MKIKEIINELERIAPPQYQESYDNSGLLVGDYDAEITGILFSLDCTEAIVKEAIDKKCNMVVAHHPIIFSGLKRFNNRNYVERTIALAIKNDVCIYAIHTNLDNTNDGVSKKMADMLGLENVKILAPKAGHLKKLYTYCPEANRDGLLDALFAAGCGKIGAYDQCGFVISGTGMFRGGDDSNPVVGKKGERHYESEIKIETVFKAHDQNRIVAALLECHPYEEVAYDIVSLDNTSSQIGSGIVGELPQSIDLMKFLNQVKTVFKCDSLRYTKEVTKDVKRIALCGGSGSFLLDRAIAVKADVFITADFKYHQFFDADNRIVIADIGHYESEQHTSELLYSVIREKFTTFALHLSEINTNPVKYLN